MSKKTDFWRYFKDSEKKNEYNSGRIQAVIFKKVHERFPREIQEKNLKESQEKLM